MTALEIVISAATGAISFLSISFICAAFLKMKKMWYESEIFYIACGGLCAMKMGKHNDTPALNASQHWAASQKVGRVRTLWRPLNQRHSQILPLRREVVSNRRILMKQTRRQFS